MNTTNIVPRSVFWIIPRNRYNIKIWVSRVSSENVSHFSEFEVINVNWNWIINLLNWISDIKVNLCFFSKTRICFHLNMKISLWNRNEKYLIITLEYSVYFRNWYQKRNDLITISHKIKSKYKERVVYKVYIFCRIDKNFKNYKNYVKCLLMIFCEMKEMTLFWFCVSQQENVSCFRLA